MRVHLPILLSLAASVLSIQLGCEQPPPQAQTITGPEAAAISEQFDGTVVVDAFEDGIVATDVTSGASRVLVPPQPPYNVHAVSGPDESGMIAYIEDHFFVPESDKKHLLKTLNVARGETVEQFSRAGSAMWATSAAGKGEIGTYLALAPRGGRVAFLVSTRSRQMPQALLTEGLLEIWEIGKQAGTVTKVVALDSPFSWFPDGNRLAYSALIRRDQLPVDAPGLEDFGSYFGDRWDELPAIFILDVATGDSEFFHLGWTPIVSRDGTAIAIGGWANDTMQWFKVAVDDKKSTRLEPPGISNDILALPTNEISVYWALPTAGTDIEYTKSNSPLRGPKLMLTIKAADEHGAFKTLVPFVDPRSSVSFGSPLPKP